MSISSTISRVDYTGNGAVDTYSYTFKIFDKEDLLVTVRDTSDVETTLTVDTHYTVTGVGNAAGGSIALVNGAFSWLDSEGDLKSGYTLTIRRVLSLKQETDIRNQGDYFPETHEDTFDKVVMQNQQQQDEIDRSLRLPETVSPANVSAELPVPEAGHFFIWNDDEDALENADPDDYLALTGTAAMKAAIYTNGVHYTAGSTTTLTLPDSVVGEDNTQVYFDGLHVEHDQYSVSGTTITFSAAIPGGTAKVEVTYGTFLPTGTSDSSAVTFDPGLSNDVATTVQSKLREQVSVKDFGAIGDGTTDDTTAINNAIASAAAASKSLYFPAGTYLISGRLLLASNIQIVGAGKYITTITFPQSNIATMNYSMFEATGAISNVSIESIGLRGNRSFQTTNLVSNNDGLAIQLNFGSVTNFTVRDCYIREFGDDNDSNGGAITLIGDASISTYNLSNIQFLDNHFGPSNNVPGIYIATYVPTNGSLVGCLIRGNRFEGGGDQNCVYILGDDNAPAKDVIVDSNQFIILENCDACIEFNGVYQGTITNNVFRNTSTGSGTPMLIRGEGASNIHVRHIVISNNIMVNDNATNKDGISIVAFDASGRQDHILVANNIFVNFGKTDTTALKVLAGSRYVSVIGNHFTTTSGTMARALDIGDFTSIYVARNVIRNATTAVRLSAGVASRDCLITDNLFDTCGSNGGSLITTTGGTLDIQGLVVTHNRVINSVASTTALASIDTTVTTNNRIFGNISDVKQAADLADWDHASVRGAIVESFVDSANRVTLTTATYNDITSIPLTPGRWIMDFVAMFEGNITGTQIIAGIGTASGNSGAGIEPGNNMLSSGQMPTANTDEGLSLAGYEVTINSNTTYYFKAQGTYSAGTLRAYGRISAECIG